MRGRWFLAEHALRMRQADTRLVLDAIARLEHVLAEKAGGVDLDRMRADLVDMADAIARTKTEIGAIRSEGGDPSHIVRATDELDAIVALTERATSDILNSAEQIQEIAWTLRERGTDANTCDRIDALTTETYTACSFQDITGQRTRKVIDALHFLERRLEAMIAIWREPGAAPAAPAPSAGRAPPTAPPVAPARAKPSLDQRDVFGTSQRQAPPPAPKSRTASADIDQLSPSEKMALFS